MLLSRTLAPMISGGWDRTNWLSGTSQWCDPLREKTDKVLVTSVLLRRRDGAAGLELIRTINRSLRTMCDRAGARYVDLYSHFDGVPGIFRDGLHLNGWGAARFGRLLNQAVVKICSPFPDVRLNSQRDRGLQNSYEKLHGMSHPSAWGMRIVPPSLRRLFLGTCNPSVRKSTNCDVYWLRITLTSLVSMSRGLNLASATC